MKSVNALTLRQSLGGVLRQLERGGEPILVQRGRQPAAVLISLRDYQERFVDREADARRRACPAGAWARGARGGWPPVWCGRLGGRPRPAPRAAPALGPSSPRRGRSAAGAAPGRPPPPRGGGRPRGGPAPAGRRGPCSSG